MSELVVVRESGPKTLTIVERDLDDQRAAEVAERARRENPGQDVEVLTTSVLSMMRLSSGYELDT